MQAIAEEFLEGKVESVKFMKSFMEERKVHECVLYTCVVLLEQECKVNNARRE